MHFCRKAALAVVASTMAVLIGGAFAQAPGGLSAEEDHRRLLDELGIEALRRGADGFAREGPHAANYDEEKANPYPRLPDILIFDDGRAVESAAQWPARRAEIAEHFDREIYGRVPDAAPDVSWRVVEEVAADEEGIAVHRKTLAGGLDNSAYPDISVEIEASLTVPADADGPVPVVLHFEFRFPPGMQLPPPPPGPSWKTQILERGWGYVEYVPVTVQEDNGEGLSRGVIGLANKGAPLGLDDWGVLRAWAWGASRVVDYLYTDDSVDSDRIAAEGLSRYGKAALVAMATDERFSAGFIVSSGKAGAALHRRNFGELVENVAGAGEYHWMAGNYLKYAGPLTADDLPVDSHMLIALCAPRPVFISVGAFEADAWTDPKGMFMAAAAARPAYELLGAKGLATDQFPPPETAFTDGEIAYRQHTGGHTAGPNWPYFLDFVARYWSPPGYQ